MATEKCEGFLDNVNTLKSQVTDDEILREAEDNVKDGSKYYFAKTVQEFKQKLKEHEVNTNTRYALRCGPKSFTRKMIAFSTKSRLHWHENMPYFHFGTRFYNCHQGKDNNIYQKKKYARERDAKIKSNNGPVVRYSAARTSKKVGCPAVVNVTRIYRMPGHQLTTKFNHKAKCKVSLAIKDYLAKGILVDGEEVYMFNLPDPSEHKNHNVSGNAALSNTLDVRLMQKITELVQQGKNGAATISKHLEAYVSTELQETDRTDEQLYPNIQTIKNAISNAKHELWSSKIDLEATYKLLQTWDISNENYLFFPSSGNNSNVVEQNKVTHCKEYCQQANDESLLFVYQDNLMKQLYRRYGSNTLLLDPAYRTCKYSIPMYLLVVKTNVNYSVVGIIISQAENKETLCKALTIITEWNPQVKPRYALVDMSKDEIAAMETVFPGISVFICSFHREQAWNRWAGRCKKGAETSDVALVFLRHVSDATTEAELQQALQELKALPFYTTTSLKSYFEWLWLNEIHRWTLAYKPDDMLFNVDNSIGCLNEQLGYKHLESFKSCLLSELIANLVKVFVPENYASYEQKNLLTINERDNSLPFFVRNRPKWLVDHVVNVYAVAQQEDYEINAVHDNKFTMQSVTCVDTKQFVNFDEESGLCHCTCHDFCATGLVCHHIVRVGLKYPKWNLENIHNWLFSNPVYCNDDNVAVVPSQNEQSVLDVSYVLDMIDTNTKHEVSVVEAMDMDQVNVMQCQPVHEAQATGQPQQQLIDDIVTSIESVKSVLGYLDKDILADLATKFKDILAGLPVHVQLDTQNCLQEESNMSHNVNNTDNLVSPSTVINTINAGEKCLSNSTNVAHVINFQAIQPDLNDGEVIIGNVVFDFECNVPLSVGAIATVESANMA